MCVHDRHMYLFNLVPPGAPYKVSTKNKQFLIQNKNAAETFVFIHFKVPSSAVVYNHS